VAGNYTLLLFFYVPQERSLGSPATSRRRPRLRLWV